MSEPAIVVDDLTKSYDATQALRGVTFSVDAGQVVGLLGPNGAGKTTLVRVLSTLLAPDGGRAMVAGQDVVRDADRVRSVIGLAGQHAAVDELLTGRENLELVGRLYQLSHVESEHRADEILQRFGLAGVGDDLVRTYSGGMRHRLDLGATLVGRPEVLLLDEPTTGLDPRSRNDLWQLIEQLVADGTTVLLTSQYLEEVDRLAANVVVIDAGMVIAEGSPDDLKKQAASDVLEATVGQGDDLDVVVGILREVGGNAPSVDMQQRTVSVPVDIGTEALVLAVRSLDAARITPTDIGLRRPTLDDVFLAITGHAAGDTAEAPSEPQAAVMPSAGTRRPPSPGSTPARDRRPMHHRRLPTLAGGIGDAVAIARRNLLRLVRTPPLLFFAVVQPVLFVVGFPAIFRGAVETPGGDYIQYMFPGILVITALLTGGGTAVALTLDLAAGLLDRFRSLPAARSAVLAGRTLADLCRNAVVIGLMVPVALAMGFRFNGGLGGALAGVGLVLSFGYAICWLYAVIGLTVKDTQTAQFLGFAPTLPLIFLSDALVPVHSLPAGLEAFARNQPVTVTIKAVRALVEGTSSHGALELSVVWIAGVLGLSLVLARHLYVTATS